MPLLARGRAIGALGFTFATARAVDEAQRDFVLTLAAHCALAIERARRLDGLQAAYEREHRIAQALQRPLLPPLAEDEFAGLSVASACQVAFEDEAEVGGDFLDAFVLPRGRVVLAVSDAAGKGLAAAVRGAQVRDVLRAFSREYPHSPAQIVARLNDYLYDLARFDLPASVAASSPIAVPPLVFVTLVLAILDPQTGDCAVVSAGAEPPLVLRGAGGELERIDTSGLPLGIEREEMYLAHPVHLAPGDTLLLFTDGLTEAQRAGAAGKEFLSDAGMETLVRQASGSVATASELAEAILRGAQAFAGGHLHDDACLVIARRR